MKLSNMNLGVYDCPVCGKPRGGRVGSGKHDRCYKILQKQKLEKNEKLAPKLARKRERSRLAYLNGGTAGVKE